MVVLLLQALLPQLAALALLPVLLAMNPLLVPWLALLVLALLLGPWLVHHHDAMCGSPCVPSGHHSNMPYGLTPHSRDH